MNCVILFFIILFLKFVFYKCIDQKKIMKKFRYIFKLRMKYFDMPWCKWIVQKSFVRSFKEKGLIINKIIMNCVFLLLCLQNSSIANNVLIWRKLSRKISFFLYRWWKSPGNKHFVYLNSFAFALYIYIYYFFQSKMKTIILSINSSWFGFKNRQ